MPFKNQRNITNEANDEGDLQGQLEQALEDGARLGAAFQNATERIGQLEADKSELEDQLASQELNGRPDPFPEIRVRPEMLLALCAVASIWSMAFGEPTHNYYAVSYAHNLAWTEGLRFVSILLFMLWSIAIYRTEGYKKLLLRYAGFGVGWGIYLFYFSMDSTVTMSRYTYIIESLSPVSWWTTPVLFGSNLGWFMFGFLVLVDANLGFKFTRHIFKQTAAIADRVRAFKGKS